MKDAFAIDRTSLSKELQLLLMLIHLEDGHRHSQLHEHFFANMDWDYFVRLTLHHRVFPSVYQKTKELQLPWVPQNVMKALDREFRKNTFEMLRLSGEMERLNKALQGRSIRFLVLKGPVLASELYGDISRRTSCDLDVLVSINDLNRVESALHEIGYVKDDYIRGVLNDWKWRHHHVTFLSSSKAMKIEVHWRLNPGPSKEPSFNKLWERKRSLLFAGSALHVPGMEDSFLFLVSHGARHGWSRLRWLSDIDRLSRKEICWDTLRELLKRHRMQHIGGQALVLATNLLGTPVTNGMKPFLSEKRAGRLAQESMFYIQRMVNLHSYPIPRDVNQYHKRHLFSLMSAGQRILFVLSFLYPYFDDAQTLPLPKPLHFLYFPLRPFLWLWRKVAA